MLALTTIGTSGRDLRGFVEALRGAAVDWVIDVRLRNTSQLAGYARGPDLEFLLTELIGITYLHVPMLAPTPEILDAFRATRDWPAYERRFMELMRERNMLNVAEAVTQDARRPCLLCACARPGHCHRRVIAEAMADARPGLRVEHL